jgi:sugar/nucleoside kinase (ribokinase family)
LLEGWLQSRDVNRCTSAGDTVFSAYLSLLLADGPEEDAQQLASVHTTQKFERRM